MNRFRWVLRRLADAFEEAEKFLRHHGKPCGNCGGCLDCLREERSALTRVNRETTPEGQAWSPIGLTVPQDNQLCYKKGK